jgi:sigma-B regulation protein RsbU (phosphoserine phosphatase)
LSDALPVEDLADLYENAPCGYVSLTPGGRIARLNGTLAGWLGRPAADMLDRPFSHYLSFGGRIAFETHLAPLLRLQGHVGEIALDLLVADGTKIPVIANAAEKRGADGQHLLTRLTMFKAIDRRTYERELVAARTRAEHEALAEHEISVLREQFIAVLGHDLRNPLAALAAGARMLEREKLSERGSVVIGEMMRSVTRATALIDDVLDLARGRLGGGLTLGRDDREPLTPVLEQIVAEVRAVAPDRVILTEFAIAEPVNCDRARIGQLAGNLISNAVTHGAPGLPIEVKAWTDEDSFVLSVSNAGTPIPAEAQARLFHPFFRGAVRRSRHGLGLGLFIVSEIAKAHGGGMEVISNESETRFLFSMPLRSG